MKIPTEEDIDIARPFQRRGVEEGAVQAEEVGGPGVVDARACQHLDAGRVGQHQLALAHQGVAIPVEEQVPVGGQAHDGHGRRPEAGGDVGVVQVQREEVRLPAIGEAAANVVPGVGRTDGQVGAVGDVEGEALAPPAWAGQVAGGEVGGDGTVEVSQGHDPSPVRSWLTGSKGVNRSLRLSLKPD
jgi:hypothetical protein